MIKRGDKKVDVCKHTKKKIVKVFDGNNWLCLHNGDEALDKKDVEAFEADTSIKK